MFSEAGIRHALAGALRANAYRERRRTQESSIFWLATKHARSMPEGL